MKIFKKITKIIILALAFFMIIGGCAFNHNNNNTAFAEVSENETQANTSYYFEISPGDYFQPQNYNVFFSDNVGLVSLNFFIDNNRYSYATWYSTNNEQNSITGQPLLKLNNFDGVKTVVTSTFRVYLNDVILNKIDINNAFCNRVSISFGGTSYNYTSSLDATTLTIYKELGYSNGYVNGIDEEKLLNNIGVLRYASNIKLNYYANDVSGVVSTVNNATVHYTPGGLTLSPYNVEYESVITDYQPDYPENFIDRCEVIITTPELYIVEDINNTPYDYAIENLILNYPTVLYGDDVIGYLQQPTVELQFGFGLDFGGTDWISFTVEELRGSAQDYLTLNKDELRPYYDYAYGYLTGIKITYYARGEFSFYEPNAVLTIDKFNTVSSYVKGLNAGYSNGYVNGSQIGYENGFQDAINGGYDNQGIFAGAVAFVRLFFELIGGFMERKIVGDITFGLIIIGIPATLMIVDLIISLIRKFLGKSGGTE